DALFKLSVPMELDTLVEIFSSDLRSPGYPPQPPHCSHAPFVPEIAASDHCSVCNAPARTSFRCVAYLGVDDGVRTEPAPRTSSGSVLEVGSKEKPCDLAPRGFFFFGEATLKRTD